MRKKWIITWVAVIMLFNVGQAQESMLSLNYSVGMPAGDLNDYIGETSFRGFNFSYSYLINQQIGFGFDAGMQTFYERKDYDTYQDGTASWSGIQYRYSNNFPLMATTSYFFRPEESLNPYAGLGIGAMYSQHDTDLGLYRSELSTWQFSLKPQVGVIYSFTPRFGVNLSGKYYHTFENPELGPQSFFAVDVGLVLTRYY